MVLRSRSSRSAAISARLSAAVCHASCRALWPACDQLFRHFRANRHGDPDARRLLVSRDERRSAKGKAAVAHESPVSRSVLILPSSFSAPDLLEVSLHGEPVELLHLLHDADVQDLDLDGAAAAFRLSGRGRSRNDCRRADRDRIGRRRVIWFSILGVLPFTLLLPFANLTWTVILTIPIGFILASAFPAIVVYAQELVPGKPARLPAFSLVSPSAWAGLVQHFSVCWPTIRRSASSIRSARFCQLSACWRSSSGCAGTRLPDSGIVLLETIFPRHGIFYQGPVRARSRPRDGARWRSPVALRASATKRLKKM